MSMRVLNFFKRFNKMYSLLNIIIKAITLFKKKALKKSKRNVAEETPPA